MTAAENARRRCEGIGGDACLARPFDIGDLLQIVELFCWPN